ncbi:IDEAL domain-containing protein [Neobacillus ginsengisoli]|uniref:Uncharacterized protein YpiB (UPF0302 family) n=1 Tax=Neobacillus ginsengisoli TaxID=904295 RepID=A0ABT9XXI0_9BACI|nr:IDEAL domain-containing protein [Neobacillus ginsengisoli]MDQ0200285.1 uncharacterized protein YpiB (UPF0302 family) [Neobacillus ginsengisoli]
MFSNNHAILKTGDWIKGKARDGELIIGYIESMSPEIPEEAVKVTVVTSDNDEMIGKTIPILSKRVNKLPISKVTNMEQIQFLIDLALSTGDKDWFIELSTELNSMKQLVKGVY